MADSRRCLAVMAVGMAWASAAAVCAQEATGKKSAAVSDGALAHIDHILLGVHDLDTGTEQLEALIGVRAAYGGKHPGRNSHNALVAVAPDAYLEIIAPVDPPTSPDDRRAGLAEYKTLTPFMFAVRTTDMTALRSHLEQAGFKTTDPQPGSRVKPDGSTLRWHTLGVSGWPASVQIGDRRVDGEPFFIQWEDMDRHPAKTSPDGGEILELSISTPDAEALARLVETLGLSRITVKKAKELAFTLRLQTPKGEKTVGAG